MSLSLSSEYVVGMGQFRAKEEPWGLSPPTSPLPPSYRAKRPRWGGENSGGRPTGLRDAEPRAKKSRGLGGGGGGTHVSSVGGRPSGPAALNGAHPEPRARGPRKHRAVYPGSEPGAGAQKASGLEVEGIAAAQAFQRPSSPSTSQGDPSLPPRCAPPRPLPPPWPGADASETDCHRQGLPLSRSLAAGWAL